MDHQTIRILLVEDDPGDIRRINSLLADVSSTHFTWERVETLSIAKGILSKEPFDLVLLDLSLPDSQGLDTFSRVYSHAICLPIVIWTDIINEPFALQAVQAGAQDYFIKGQIDSEQLVRALRQAIARKHIETALRVKVRELTVVAQQLERAVRIGHDLNNSLATVMLSIEALLAQIPQDDLKHTDLQIVHDEISRMGHTVASLLQLSHRTSPHVPKGSPRQDRSNNHDFIQDMQNHRIIPVQRELTYFFQAVDDGTAGYILKGDSANELIAMTHRVFQEGIWIPRTLGPRLLHHSPEGTNAGKPQNDGQLSAGEREVLHLIARGCTNKEIAKSLSISGRTVERHRSSIMKKLGFQKRSELVTYAVQYGFWNGNNAK